jgi:hypothetical protein
MPYMQWSGDNVGYGVESVLLNLNEFGQNDLIRLNCKAFWYRRRDNGNMALEVKGYLGGTMSLNGYQFENTGGTLTKLVSFSKNIETQESLCIEGEDLGVVSYNKRTKVLAFIPA